LIKSEIDHNNFIGEPSVFAKNFKGFKENCIAIERSAVLELPKSWIITLEELVYEEKQAEKYNIAANFQL